MTGHSGGVIGGRVLLAMRPDAIERLSRDRKIILISGTNGKTTTTLFLTRALSTSMNVSSNHTGANLFSGISFMLLGAGDDDWTTIETDEGVLNTIIEEANPRFVLLLNLSRDQLDRFGDLRLVAARIRNILATTTELKVIANASDPYIVWIAEVAPNVQWIDVGEVNWNQDQLLCPRCGGVIEWVDNKDWSCECGFKKPEASTKVDGHTIAIDDTPYEVQLKLPGQFQYSNAAFALTCAASLGVDPEQAIDSFDDVNEVQGRFRVRKVGKSSAQLLLAKNPAGWVEMLALVAQRKNPVILVVNSRIADGRDVAWLWDIDFSSLAGRRIFVGGERATEVAARLYYGGVTVEVFRGDLIKGIKSFPAGHVDIIANYTAFREISGKMP